MVLLALLLTTGMRLVVRDGFDYRKGIVAGVSFWIGVGFQQEVIFHELLHPWWSGLLGNGMTAGGITAIVLIGLMNLMSLRSERIRMKLGPDSLPELLAFFNRVGARFGWNPEQSNRLRLAGEEAVRALLDANPDGDTRSRLLRVKARKEGSAIELEFVSAGSESNVEDKIMLLGERFDTSAVEHDISLRLLHHFASSVHHQRYRNTDVLTVRLDKPPPRRGASDASRGSDAAPDAGGGW